MVTEPRVTLPPLRAWSDGFKFREALRPIGDRAHGFQYVFCLQMRSAVICGFVVGYLASSVYTARAEVTIKDLQIMGRAFSFTDSKPAGEIRLGIVYSPGNSVSTTEAENVQRLLGVGLKAGAAVLKPVLVRIDDAGSAPVDAFLLTEGIGSETKEFAAATKTMRKLCFTVDLEQVRSGNCIMGVRSEPKVEIVVNKDAAAERGIGFSPSFRMLITEL